MFDATEDDLRDIPRAHEGRPRLPDLQRRPVRGDRDGREPVASIARGLPPGAPPTLETGGEVRFEPRPVEGAPDVPREPGTPLLDGRQRITSLHPTPFSEAPVRIRGTDGVMVEPHYYLDMRAALGGGSMEDAVRGVPVDRVARRNFGRDVVLDPSTPERKHERGMLPLDRTFEFRTWSRGWHDHRHGRDEERAAGSRARLRGRAARDVGEPLPWNRGGGPIPRVVQSIAFREDRLMSLRTRNPAAYRARHALPTRAGCRGFVAGNPVETAIFHAEGIDIRPIFPKACCEARGLDRGVWSCIVDETPLSAASDRSLGGRAPSNHLRRIERDRGAARRDPAPPPHRALAPAGGRLRGLRRRPSPAAARSPTTSDASRATSSTTPRPTRPRREPPRGAHPGARPMTPHPQASGSRTAAGRRFGPRIPHAPAASPRGSLPARRPVRAGEPSPGAPA